jgi:lipopolysaccharide export system protein LptA
MCPADSKWLAIATLLVLLGNMPAAGQALSSDRYKPIHIEADNAKLEESKGISRYQGNVHLHQGSLNLRGESMTVHISGRSVTKVVVTGLPASFSQRPDGKSADLNAEAERMEYIKSEERIILTGKARVWQQDGNEFASDRINYDIRNNIVIAGGDSEENRVSITLQPGKKGNMKKQEQTE